jgi:hypothetical protein
VIAEEHVAMIDLAVDGEDIDGADTAFAALAVGHHFMPASLSASSIERFCGTTISAPLPFSRTRNSAGRQHSRWSRRFHSAGLRARGRRYSSACRAASSIRIGPHMIAMASAGRGCKGRIEIQPCSFVAGMNVNCSPSSVRYFVEIGCVLRDRTA